MRSQTPMLSCRCEKIVLDYLLISVIFLSLIMPVGAGQNAPPPLCRQIQATLLRRYKAYGHHNAQKYLALYSPNYVEILQTGKPYTFASLRKGILASFSKPGRPPYWPCWTEYRIQRCNVTHNSATVNALITIGYPVYQSNSIQINHYFYGDGHVIDIWQKTANGWVLKHRKEIYFRTSAPMQRRFNMP